jgi:8-oxo-dGTP pyrophosphatase MutT (NUDIX family)
MNHYTLIFIFDSTFLNVILQEKLRSKYAGKLNGVGGKVEHYDTSILESAYRELKEETGIVGSDLKILLSELIRIYVDDTTLTVFYGVLEWNKTFTQLEDEILSWVPIKETQDITDTRFAGAAEISVSHFIAKSIQNYKIKEEEVNEWKKSNMA